MNAQTGDIQALFKLLGKLIYLSNLANTHSDAYRNVTIATVTQGVTGQADEFDLFDQVLAPMETKTKAVITALGKLPDQMSALIQIVITNFGAAWESPATTVSGILDDVAFSMNSLGLYIDTQYQAFFTSVLSYGNLPVAGATLIPNDWITDSVV